MRKPPHQPDPSAPGANGPVTAEPDHRDRRKGRGARLREWLAERRPFGPRCPADSAPGLVLLKIDGLSYDQLQRAFAARRMPYLRHLAATGPYTLKPLYAGVPSSTPVVQAELFFGVRTSIPAIAYFDRQEQKRVSLLLPAAADAMARRLAGQGRPLLEGGRSYANIYAGGAEEARYCIQTMRLRSFRHLASSLKLFLLLMLQPVRWLKMLGYVLLEIALAFSDLFQGVLKGKSVFRELKFVPMRLLISILLRELVRTRVKMDVARGVPIVHASFLGYDEQAHRRGPRSAFAHWCLKGIDDTIRSIHRSALRSRCRRYRLVVYADHGQETVTAYEKFAGRSLEETVARAVQQAGGFRARRVRGPDKDNRLSVRTRGMIGKSAPRAGRLPPVEPDADRPQIVALGPLGHIYLAGSARAALKEKVAAYLVREGGIPLVLFLSGIRVLALNAWGAFDLEKDAEAVLGTDHAFAIPAAADLAAACRHPDAGDLVISGWRPGGSPLSFAFENGAHGGPGREETRAFVLIPDEMDDSVVALRPSDLRARILALFESPGG